MKNKDTGRLWSAIMFIILGFIFLIESFFPQLDFEDFWPILLIITGIIVIYDGLQERGATKFDKYDDFTHQDKNNRDNF